MIPAYVVAFLCPISAALGWLLCSLVAQLKMDILRDENARLRGILASHGYIKKKGRLPLTFSEK